MPGKADGLVMPEALPVKGGRGLERVPIAVMGVTAVIAGLLEQTAHGDVGLIQGLGQRGQPPAEGARKELF